MGLFGFLALLFVVVPIVELMVLIELGQAVGLWPTLLLVLSTGVGGAMLARAEGMRTFLRFQGELASGQMPGQSIFDGISVLIGGVLLLTPGLLTDLFGFSLLIPFTRRWIQRRAQARLTRMAAEGTIQIVNVGPAPGWAQARSDGESDTQPPLDPSKEIAVEAQPGGGT
jgi:UPF0716 protein FxsA